MDPKKGFDAYQGQIVAVHGIRNGVAFHMIGRILHIDEKWVTVHFREDQFGGILYSTARREDIVYMRSGTFENDWNDPHLPGRDLPNA